MLNLRTSVLLTLLAASTAASPAPAADPNLESRQNPRAVRCGNNDFSTSQVNDAFNRGCRLSSGNQRVGDDDFPHEFDGGGGNFDFGGGSHQEFPILANGVFNGGNPGDHRVVFDRGNGGSCNFVGAVTHSGQQNNRFASCRNR